MKGEPLCFVSHQWTGFNSPDHTQVQLKLLQRFFWKVSCRGVSMCCLSNPPLLFTLRFIDAVPTNNVPVCT